MKEIGITEKKIAFYKSLVEIIQKSWFDKSSADVLVVFFGRITSAVLLEGFSMEYMEKARRAYHEGRDLEIIEELAETVFADLSGQMRSPEVRRIFSKLLEMTASESDLYIHEVNVRLLSGDEKGPAVVTLVVHNYEQFKNLLESGWVSNSKVEKVHATSMRIVVD